MPPSPFSPLTPLGASKAACSWVQSPQRVWEEAGSQGHLRVLRVPRGMTHSGKMPHPHTLTFSTSMFLSAMTASGPWKRCRREGDGVRTGAGGSRTGGRGGLCRGHSRYLPGLRPVRAVPANRCVLVSPKVEESA